MWRGAQAVLAVVGMAERQLGATERAQAEADRWAGGANEGGPKLIATLRRLIAARGLVNGNSRRARNHAPARWWRLGLFVRCLAPIIHATS